MNSKGNLTTWKGANVSLLSHLRIETHLGGSHVECKGTSPFPPLNSKAKARGGGCQEEANSQPPGSRQEWLQCRKHVLGTGKTHDAL